MSDRPCSKQQPEDPTCRHSQPDVTWLCIPSSCSSACSTRAASPAWSSPCEQREQDGGSSSPPGQAAAEFPVPRPVLGRAVPLGSVLLLWGLCSGCLWMCCCLPGCVWELLWVRCCCCFSSWLGFRAAGSALGMLFPAGIPPLSPNPPQHHPSPFLMCIFFCNRAVELLPTNTLCQAFMGLFASLS